MTSRSQWRVRRHAPLILLLFVLLALPMSSPAAAAPPGPTMGLEELRAALAPGPLDGYLLTTMAGTTPEQIPVQVQSLVDYPWGSLILFEASGPWIDRIGGIAAGMSGSPIYVDDGGVDKLVGALSYGDIFTLNGLGLATPIEYMAAIEEAFPVDALAALRGTRPPAAGTYALDAPVATSAGLVRSVRIARGGAAAAHRVQAVAGEAVMVPLGLLEIGGARPGTAAFDRVAAKFEKSGFLVKAAPGTGRWAGPATPDLGPGSPCAILFSQGALWVGAAGTVTYVDGDTALIFGHPFEQFGPIEADLTGGDVQGVWASSIEPYKLIAPRDVKGACLQDRTWGVEARLGEPAESFPVTTSVTAVERGVTVDDESSVCQWLFSSGAYASLPAEVAAQVAYTLLDQYSYAGSAETTTRVVVADDTGTYTYVHDNIWSDPWDVVWLMTMDADGALWSLSDDSDGVLDARVVSVDVDASVSPVQRSARITAVTLPDGWGHGENTVRIEYYRYASATPETLDATLIVPAGTSLFGSITVRPAIMDEGEGDEEGGMPVTGPPPTLADMVDELNAQPRNSDLVVSYQPAEDEGMPAATTIDATLATGYVFSGQYAARTALVTLQAQPKKVGYGEPVVVTGTVMSATDIEVDLYRRDVGATGEVKVATVMATSRYGTASFEGVVPAVRKNTTLIARVASADGSLPGSASVAVKVSPRIWLSGAARLSVHVRPGEADGNVVLQRKRAGVWRNYKTLTIVDGYGATSLPRGTHTLRARFSGSPLCTAGTSRAFTIRVE